MLFFNVYLQYTEERVLEFYRERERVLERDKTFLREQSDKGFCGFYRLFGYLRCQTSFFCQDSTVEVRWVARGADLFLVGVFSFPFVFRRNLKEPLKILS